MSKTIFILVNVYIFNTFLAIEENRQLVYYFRQATNIFEENSIAFINICGLTMIALTFLYASISES